MEKGLVRLYPVDIDRLAWRQVAAEAPVGVGQKILARDARTGSVTRLIKVEPHVDQGIFVHEHWEEVYVLEGSKKIGEEFHPAGTYTCKPPGIEHGPILTAEGFLSVEFRDYHPESIKKPMVRLFPMDIMRLPWEPGDGAERGSLQRTLALDVATGSSTVLFRLDAGVELPPATCEWCEELYILAGSCKIGSEFYPMGTYISRPASIERGLVTTRDGLLALRVRNAA